jgi:omega-amidase
MPQYAESIPDGPTSRRWAGLAKELGVWLLGGSMIEPVEGKPGKLYNTAVLFSDSGMYHAAHSVFTFTRNKQGRYHHR